MKRLLITFAPFWLFLILFKLGGAIHYSLISPLGERILPLWIVGALMGAGSLIELALDIPAGRILDRFGYLRLLKFATSIFLFAGVALFFEFTIIAYLISLAIATFGWLFFGPGVNAYILSHAPQEAAGRFMSLRDIFGSIGVVLASAVLGIILSLDVKTMGILIASTMAIALLSLFFSPKDAVRKNTAEKNHARHPQSIQSTLKILRRLNPASSMLLLLNITSSIFYGVIWFVVPIVIAHQADSSLLSLGLGVFDFAIVMLGFTLGNIADKGNKRSLVFFGLLLFSVSGMFLGFNFSWLFLIFGFLATTGDEMASISLWSWLHALDKDHANDGLLAGILTLFQDLGWAIGPILAGILYPIIGPSWIIAGAASLIFCTWVIYQFMMRHHVHSPLLNSPRKPHRPRHKT